MVTKTKLPFNLCVSSHSCDRSERSDVSYSAVVTVVTNKLFQKKTFFFFNFHTKNFSHKNVFTKKNSKAQIVMKLKNSIVMREKKSNCGETQKL